MFDRPQGPRPRLAHRTLPLIVLQPGSRDLQWEYPCGHRAPVLAAPSTSLYRATLRAADCPICSISKEAAC